MSRSALAGDLVTGVTSASNYSSNNKCPKVKILGLNRGFLYHNVALRQQTWPELSKKPSKSIPKMSCPALVGNMTGVTSANNHSVFIEGP